MIGGLIALVVSAIGAVVGVVLGVASLIVGIVVPAIVGILVPMVVLGVPLLLLFGIVKLFRIGARSCARPNRNRSRVLFEVDRGLARMEQRLDSLETIMETDRRRWRSSY